MGFLRKIKSCGIDLLLSVLTGGLLALALPGFNIFPLAFIGFALFFYTAERKVISAKVISFIVGFIFYTTGLSWIGTPMTLFGGAPLYAGVALVVLTGIVGAALFWFPFGLVFDKTRSLLLSGLVFIALEMAKSNILFGGLPWLNIGQTQYNNIYALQIVSIGGEYVLSLLVILIGGGLYKAIILRRKENFAALAVLLVVAFGYGFLRLALSRPLEPSYTVRLVQTGLKQEDKWDHSKRNEVLVFLKREVSDAIFADGEYDLLILPETAFPTNPFTISTVADLIMRGSIGHPIILGYDRYELNEEGGRALFNSAVMINDMEFSQVYDKMKLAPFGEYFPLEKLLKPIKKYFFGDSTGFTAGSKRILFEYTLRYKDIKAAPLICFEGAFSGIISGSVNAGANLLVVISNDSWFGESIGRVQNFAINMVRAAEYKRYILRSTQDGLTGVISPYGGITARLPEKSSAYGDFNFEPISDITLFARFGYIWYVVTVAAYAFWYAKFARKKDAQTLDGGKL
ncbi:MAG: apolipoprotein N-acyltransferase [Deferribacteraceae bacterium]|jgi:apolipoprotein N-acyltransferase|nr:apolipoprotein N-acyltransferase [Deferribacteraceae bacterium]